jgi:O-antigen/teichoic acid export membrane protein
MSQLKKLAGQSAIYGISSILGKTINFLLIPLYTGYLSKEDLGSFTMIYALIAFLNVVFTFGMETAYFRYATGKGLSADRVFKNAHSMVGLVAIALGIVLYLWAEGLAELLDYPGQGHLFRWVAFILAIDALMAIPYAKLRIEGRALSFALIKLLNICLNVALNIFFIVFCYHVFRGDWFPSMQPLIEQIYNPSWGVDYILLSNLIANALILPLLFLTVKSLGIKLEKEILAPMWQYAMPLLFMGLAGVTNEVFSRGLFEYALPEGFYEGLSTREAGGIFGANFKLAIFMNLIIQAFKYAAEPFFFQQATNKNNPQLFARVMHWFIIFCTILMVAVAVNLDLIASIFFQSEGYEAGLSMVPLLLMGYLLLGIYYNLSIWFKITDQTSYSFYITAIGAIVTIVVIFAMVPRFGFMGGALSTFICYGVMCVLCYYYGQRHYPIPYQTQKGLIFLLVAFIFSYSGFVIQTQNQLLDFFIHNLFIIAYGFFVFTLEKKELSSLFEKFRKK